MTYQPIYATLDDGVSVRSTHSLRGIVDNIRVWLNSKVGEVGNVVLHYRIDDEQIKRVMYCKEKLNEWKEKGIESKIKEWQDKLDKEQKILDNTDNKIYLYIDINDNSYFHVEINGKKFDIKKGVLKDE